VPLGVDLDVWPPREPVARDARVPARLIHAASLNGVKDQPTLLRALALLAADGVDFNVDIVGGDTLAGRVQALAQELGLAARTSFHGFRTHAQLYRLLERAHVNLVSSLHEAGPLVVLEAAALGVPTAGTAVGHLAEWSPSAAFAVPPGDAPALAAAIRRLLDDEPLRLRIAAEAKRRSLAHDADHTAARFERLYAELGAS
jgi:glycosyltransferase involved in cell wall biosynthesis